MSFGPLQIQVDGTVLEPRPWTYAQSTWAAELLESLPPGDVLELCAGAGQIGLGAVHGTGRRLVMVDAEPRACALARLNAAQVEEDVEVREGRFDAVLDPAERFALVVADPPWVPSQRVAEFPEDPVWAIDGGIDGLEVARRCVRTASRHLAADGRVLLQLGSVVRAGGPGRPGGRRGWFARGPGAAGTGGLDGSASARGLTYGRSRGAVEGRLSQQPHSYDERQHHGYDRP